MSNYKSPEIPGPFNPFHSMVSPSLNDPRATKSLVVTDGFEKLISKYVDENRTFSNEQVFNKVI